MTVYVPDDLKAQMDQAEADLNWSAITQHAIRKAIATQTLKRNPTDMTIVIERLRASKQRHEKAAFDHGQECGSDWARTKAEYDELLRVAKFAEVNPHGTLNDLQGLIDPHDELDPHSWDAFWEDCGEPAPDDVFARGFIQGAAAVFRKVADKL
jgi:hypothetical protein